MTRDHDKAVKFLSSGGVIIYPTDTAFGIGCRIDDERLVERLFAIRRRSHHKATPVLVSSIEMAKKWVDDIPPKVQKLMDQHWPGGLTIILNSSDPRISNLVRGGTKTLGVRMPDHPELLSIIEELGVPIIGSSANFEGEATPYSLEEIDPKLIKLVDFVLPGKCKTKEQSTVVDCTKEEFQILREGAVKL